MRRTCAIAVAIGVVLAITGCAGRRRADEVDDPAPRTWAESRAAYLERSQVWLGGDLRSWVRHMRTLDLAAGPGGVAPGALVDCADVAPKPGQFSGATPKFICRTGRGGDRTWEQPSARTNVDDSRASRRATLKELRAVHRAVPRRALRERVEPPGAAV